MRFLLCVSLLVLIGLALPAAADDLETGPAGHFQARLRLAGVIPDPSATIAISGANIGGTTKVTDSFIPEADLTYFITDNIGVEAIAAITKGSRAALATLRLSPLREVAHFGEHHSNDACLSAGSRRNLMGTGWDPSY